VASSTDRIWREIDHELVHLKLGEELKRAYPKEYQAWTDSHSYVFDLAQRLRLYLEVIYQVYCNVWQIQKKKKSVAFVQTVHRRAIIPSLRGAVEGLEQEVANDKTGFHSQRDPRHFRELVHDIEREWESRIEMEIKECKYAERLPTRRIRSKTPRSLSEPIFDHDPTYSVVRYRDITCRPTKIARRVIAELDKAYNAGRPEMGTEEIRRKAELGAHGNMYDWINKGGCAPFWRTLIVTVRKGVYCLNLHVRVSNKID
jgi:hypothetical protein